MHFSALVFTGPADASRHRPSDGAHLTMNSLLMLSAIMVARPIPVSPIRRIPAASQAKWSVHAC